MFTRNRYVLSFSFLMSLLIVSPMGSAFAGELEGIYCNDSYVAGTSFYGFDFTGTSTRSGSGVIDFNITHRAGACPVAFSCTGSSNGRSEVDWKCGFPVWGLGKVALNKMGLGLGSWSSKQQFDNNENGRLGRGLCNDSNATVTFVFSK